MPTRLLGVITVLVVMVVLTNADRARAACSAPSFAESQPRPPGAANRPRMPSCVATQRLTGREAVFSRNIRMMPTVM